MITAEVFQIGDPSENRWYCRLVKGPCYLFEDNPEYSCEADSFLAAKKAMKHRLIQDKVKGEIFFTKHKNSQYIWPGRAVLSTDPDDNGLWHVSKREGQWWVCHCSHWHSPMERITIEKKFKSEHLIPCNEQYYIQHLKMGYLSKEEIEENAQKGPQQRIIDDNLFSMNDE